MRCSDCIKVQCLDWLGYRIIYLDGCTWGRSGWLNQWTVELMNPQKLAARCKSDPLDSKRPYMSNWRYPQKFWPVVLAVSSQHCRLLPVMAGCDSWGWGHIFSTRLTIWSCKELTVHGRIQSSWKQHLSSAISQSSNISSSISVCRSRLCRMTGFPGTPVACLGCARSSLFVRSPGVVVRTNMHRLYQWVNMIWGKNG